MSGKARETLLNFMKKQPMEKTELEKQLEAELAQEASPSETAEPPPPSLEEQIAQLSAERDDLKDQWLRGRAEFDNYRKRMIRENDRVRKTAAESILRDLLPVLDNLDRALEHAGAEAGGLAEGVDMILKQLREALGRHGLATIPTVGVPFDPNVHEAVMNMPGADVPPNHVAMELQKGYRLGDFVLRPAKVAVSTPAPEPSEEPEKTD